MEERYSALDKAGISSLHELIKALDSKPRLQALSDTTGLSTDYLVLLKREASSYLARPFNLDKLPGIPFEYAEVLKSKGIGNSKVLFETLQGDEDVKSLSHLTGIPKARLEELRALCDLSRINGVGPLYARIIYDAGIRSVEGFVETSVEAHQQSYLEAIEKYGYQANALSDDDIQWCLDYAGVILENRSE
jgi:hypothetical protein